MVLGVWILEQKKTQEKTLMTTGLCLGGSLVGKRRNGVDDQLRIETFSPSKLNAYFFSSTRTNFSPWSRGISHICRQQKNMYTYSLTPFLPLALWLPPLLFMDMTWAPLTDKYVSTIYRDYTDHTCTSWSDTNSSNVVRHLRIWFLKTHMKVYFGKTSMMTILTDFINC